MWNKQQSVAMDIHGTMEPRGEIIGHINNSLQLAIRLV